VGNVLVVVNDKLAVDLVRDVLTTQGCAVSSLPERERGGIRTAAAQLEPDCMLLDGESWSEYGRSWEGAAGLHAREGLIPVIMFTADLLAALEAEDGSSARSRSAGFTAVLRKPFDLDALVETVSRASGWSARCV
jgi:CheY-like chemotaxis protein